MHCAWSDFESRIFLLLETFDRVSHRQVSKVKYLYVELVKGIVRGRVSHGGASSIATVPLMDRQVAVYRASRTIRAIGQSARQPNESLQCLESIQLWYMRVVWAYAFGCLFAYAQVSDTKFAMTGLV